MASEEHKELSDIIKNVHIKLRIKAKEGGAEEAWKQHVADDDQLKYYASAMLKLATEHWDKNNMSSGSLCRIQWVVDKCHDYFFHGGLEKSVEKEKRLFKNYFDKELVVLVEQNGNFFNVEQCLTQSKICLLDVGSCYNPFKKYEGFHTVPVDLIPATDDVFKCDFLNVSLVKDKRLIDIKNPCEFLPENSFHVVVFSLLLEYFPSSKQRFICCKKAYDILKINGILIILTPDSKHAAANAKIIKFWRYAVADIGYILVHYEKLKHLHCIIYRKCISKDVPNHWLSKQHGFKSARLETEKMVSIPQDFNDYVEKVDKVETKHFKSEDYEQLIVKTFSELPIVEDCL